MARRSQCSSAGDDPFDPNYLPPHYREEYRLAIDVLVEENLDGYYQFLQNVDVVDFLSTSEIQYIQSSVQLPRHISEPEQHFLDTDIDGSSGTYWPIHSDLDVPGLDLGWPQMNPFLGPTEVTTLINPPEPDMPSIKEQARRLIKNAQQVVAIVMDLFTDVDMFADVLNAAMRNVAVYILLDELNAHHFMNMVSNCRVDLQTIPCLCVRTVSGSTYQCCSGKSFKGQVMDRFLLTDCRAVLSGNYSFMWSFEKLHRCMAHLFLGQLVTTFDEEFRILFAQSQPLRVDNMLNPMDDESLLYTRQYPNKKSSLYREPKRFRPVSAGHPDEWIRHSHDERLDPEGRMIALKRQESLHGPAEMYGRYAPQQPRLDPYHDQGSSRIPMMDNVAFKRHSYAEGAHGRFSLPFMQQQEMLNPESHGKPFQRGQQPFPGQGPEGDYGGYNKFWGQEYYSGDHYSEPGLPHNVQPASDFDPVLNYLSSTRNLDFDQSSEKLQPAVDLPFSSSYPRRLSLGHTHTAQTSPTPSSSAEQKQFFLDPPTDRKDPMVKRGLRDWRISSFLSACEEPAEDPLAVAPPQALDYYEEPLNPMQQTTPALDYYAPKIPNVQEFKVPAVPRGSQIPSYGKPINLEQAKKFQDEPAAGLEIKATQRPSEVLPVEEKLEEAAPREPKTSVLRREESFKRNYNAATQRSSRLRSSLIFSSLEQQQAPQETSAADPIDEQNETDPKKPSFVSQVMGHRRSTPREPFEWKAAALDKSSTGSSKESSKEELSESPEAQESIKQPDVKPNDPSPSTDESKISGAELPKTDLPVQPSKPALTTPLFVDMNDPDQRFMFFKELAAKRRAAKAAEAEKKTDKAPMKPPLELLKHTSQKEKPAPDESTERLALASEGSASAEVKESINSPTDANSGTNKTDAVVPGDFQTSQSCSEQEVKDPEDSERKKMESESAADTEPSLAYNPNLPAAVDATPSNVVEGNLGLTSFSNEPFSVASSSVEVSPQPDLNSHNPPEPDDGPRLSSDLPDPSFPHSDSKICLPTTSQSSVSVSESSSVTDETKNQDSKQESSSSAVDVLQTSDNLRNPDYSPRLTTCEDLPASDSFSTTEVNCEKVSSESPESETLKPSEESKDDGTISELEPDPESSAAALQEIGIDPPEASETSSHRATDVSSETAGSPQDSESQAAPTQRLHLTDSTEPSEPGCLSLAESDPTPLTPETEDTTDISSPNDPFISSENKQQTEESDLFNPSPSSPDDSTSKPLPEPDLPCKTLSSEIPAPEALTPTESAPAESELVIADEMESDHLEDTNKENKHIVEECASHEKTNDQVKQSNVSEQTEVTSKQPKSNQSRYHSSTANVLSSSNLRDDTKLLLEQISANCQNRNEATKESPVTDDEKEDEADKNAMKEKERGFRTLRGPPKSPQEREKLLERIQSMRKERKVYSRFEMAP